MATTTSPCLFYSVRLNPDTRTPIPSTMMGHLNDNKIADPCLEARVPATQMSRVNRCTPPGGFRYFYKVNKSTGTILGNSMYQSKKAPATMCSGGFNILEFFVYAQ